MDETSVQFYKCKHLWRLDVTFQSGDHLRSRVAVCDLYIGFSGKVKGQLTWKHVGFAPFDQLLADGELISYDVETTSVVSLHHIAVAEEYIHHWAMSNYEAIYDGEETVS